PNPAKDIINFINIDGKKEIKIFDINSKQILKKTINSNELSIEKLKPGFYFMEINGQYKKLIKE
ncbi:MAG: T9SS type A sorting domain-containing protein, partial [Polaribacter sp.]